ncbi:hypothetical protein [Desulfofustis phage LS06-2018-MD01]|nr:hypothetical protein [Desulfofustis phage LS06-2018-MD01]
MNKSTPIDTIIFTLRENSTKNLAINDRVIKMEVSDGQ